MIRHWKALVATLSMLSSRTTAHTLPRAVDNSSNPFTPEFSKFAESILEEWRVPGVSLAVIDGDNIYAQGYGFATFPDTKVTPDTLFYAGSTTKAFVAATLSHLIDTADYPELSDGWSTTFASIIYDDFVMETEWATSHLTLEDAAVHRTGLPRHDSSWAREVNGRPATTKDIVRNFRNLHLSLEPRVQLQYCNLMYVALSYVIEHLTGKWLGDVLREQIWEPLRMTATFFSLEDAQKAPQDLATGYLWNGKDFKPMPFDSTREFSGAGAMISNARDYAKWVKCLANGAAPFSNATHKDIRTPRIIDAEDPNTVGDISLYGLAWSRTNAHGRVVINHGGTETAYGTQVFWLPEERFGVVAFANAVDNSNNVNQVLVWELIENKLQVDPKDRFNINDLLKKGDDGNDGGSDPTDPDDLVFPNRPKVPLPSPVTAAKLKGKYHDAGYGTIDLVEEREGNKTILVADRRDLVEAHQLRLHHVSGNFWNVHVFGYSTNTTDNYLAGEFKIGVDGTPAALEVRLSPLDADIDEGTVLYERLY